MGALCSKSEVDLHNQAKRSRGNEMSRAESGSAAAAAMLGSNNLSSRVEIFVSCRNLKDLDTGSLSDPFCILEEYVEPRINRGQQQQQQQKKAQWMEIGRSEIVVNSLNPDFVTRFKMQYHFEETQKIRVRIFDADDGAVPPNKLDLARQDFIGETPTAYLADVINSSRPARSSKTFQLEGNTKKGKARGECIIKVEEMKNQNGYVTLRVRGKGLTNKDGMFGKSDPFLRLSRVAKANNNNTQNRNRVTRHGGVETQKMPVFKTEVVMNNLNPRWNDAVVSLQGLCNGDLNRAILFEVFDYDSDGSHDFIGSVTASVNDLTNGRNSELGLISKSGKSGGSLFIDHINVEYRPSFLDYVMVGVLHI